jgi:uncharacterized membrane protein
MVEENLTTCNTIVEIGNDYVFHKRGHAYTYGTISEVQKGPANAVNVRSVLLTHKGIAKTPL